MIEGLEEKLDKYANQEKLQEEISTVLKHQKEGVAALLHYRGKTVKALLNDFSENKPVHTGCVAKSFTATLVAIAQAEGKLNLQDYVSNYLDNYQLPQSIREHFRHLKIGSLMNHTSGLDYSRRIELTRNEKGFINTNLFIEGLGNRAVLSEPGVIFSYDNLGPWLTAAILEAVYERTYRDLLNEKLLLLLEMKAIPHSEDVNVCPSIGGDVGFSARDLLKLALFHLNGDSNNSALTEALVCLREEFSYSMPEFPQTGKNMYPGWVDFGENYGQLGFGDKGAGVLRFFPEYDAAIAITAEHEKLANLTLAMLFKDVLEDFSALQPPKFQDQASSSNTDLFCGIYENSAYRLNIDKAANGYLRVKVFRLQNESGEVDKTPFIKRYLRPALKQLLMPMQPEPIVCPILQFSHSQQNGRYKYVKTGNYVFVHLGDM